MYEFTRLKKFVIDRYGVDPDAVESTFQPIIHKMTRQELNKRVRMSRTGIVYTDDNGVQHKGFLYVGKGYTRAYPDSHTGGVTLVPRFHTCSCQTISDQIQHNRYDGHYVFAEQHVEMPEHDGSMASPLLCSNCQTIMPQLPQRIDTAAFEKILRDDDLRAGRFRATQLPKVVEVLDSGYTPDWAEKSRSYREKNGFRCENCGIQLNGTYAEGFYLQTHHINANTSDNRDINLKCLCVLCHANVDEHHKHNYRSGMNRRNVLDFIELFRDRLVEMGNPYI